MSHRHGLSFHRGIDVPCSPFSHFGRFGRLFPTLPAYPELPPGPVDDLENRLAALADSMKETDTSQGDDEKVPAGITFLGQFIDHDMTLDVTSSLEQSNDPTAIHNFRTPLLELDSVYGQGPEATPFLYDRNEGRHGYLLTGTDANPDDLPRNIQGQALIGDPRNDENVIISQLHLLFLRFHNKVLEMVEHGDDLGPRYHQHDDFREAQRLVRWHYQWIVVHELLPAIVDDKVLESILEDGFKIGACHWHIEPFMPIEFAVAAYRFGHSQVRNRYRLNVQHDENNQVGLFRQPGETDDLTAFGPVSPSFVIRWENFFDVPGGGKPQSARKIDTLMAEELFALPFVGHPDPRRASLAFRNLRRAVSFGLPSGEMVARFLGVEVVETDLSSRGGFDQTPLWYYCLREAEELGGKLGEVGGRIVAETILGMLHGDPLSYLRLAPTWRPVLPSKKSQEFTMGDLAKLVEG